MKILIAEDQEIMLRTLAFKLAKDGYEVIAVKDGREAILKIREEQPDLIITDMMMPYQNGLEVIVETKKYNKEIPILMLSSVGHEKMVVKAFDLGVDDYMTKPFSPNELTMRVQKLTGSIV